MTPQRLIAGLYTVAISGLAVYAAHITVLIALYLRHRSAPSPVIPPVESNELPTVTVQIPLYNERYVVQRVLQAVAALDWPRDRLHIQVLDDSSDDTTALARADVTRLQKLGYQIQLHHRRCAEGYKAGALASGLKHVNSEYVAIFDADFCPPADFLRLTVPYLVRDRNLALVQARWGHLNEDYSPITRAQALALDAHFVVEHIARNRAGLLMNFNGTAGVWRRRAIDAAGGWQYDTIAEDLDLSYRAQLAGWHVLYLPAVVAPAELPPLVWAFKQQQYRWAKGATQTLRKLALPILRSPRLTFPQKVMAFLHLSGYLTQPLLLLLLLLVLPMAIYTPRLPAFVAALGTLTMLPSLLYLLGQAELHRDWPRRILAYPVLLLLGIGIAWSSTVAIVDGLCHWGGTFQRTPKYKLRDRSGDWKTTRYRTGTVRVRPDEILVSVYAIATFALTVVRQRTNLLFLSTIFVAGNILVMWGAYQQRHGTVHHGTSIKKRAR